MRLLQEARRCCMCFLDEKLKPGRLIMGPRPQLTTFPCGNTVPTIIILKRIPRRFYSLLLLVSWNSLPFVKNTWCFCCTRATPFVKKKQKRERGGSIRQSTWKDFYDSSYLYSRKCFKDDSALKVFYNHYPINAALFKFHKRNREVQAYGLSSAVTQCVNFIANTRRGLWGSVLMFTPSPNTSSPTLFHINNSPHWNKAWLPQPKPWLALLHW